MEDGKMVLAKRNNTTGVGWMRDWGGEGKGKGGITMGFEIGRRILLLQGDLSAVTFHPTIAQIRIRRGNPARE